MIESTERLGAQDFGGYPSIKQHDFFESINFDTLYLKTPPCPTNLKDVVDSNSPADEFNEFQDAEPGLGGQQLSRLLGLQLNDDKISSCQSSAGAKEITAVDANTSTQPAKRSVIQFPTSDQQLQSRLQQQRETLPQWHNIVDKKLILKQGLIDKKKVVL